MATLWGEGLLQPEPEHGPDPEAFGLGDDDSANFFILALKLTNMV